MTTMPLEPRNHKITPKTMDNWPIFVLGILWGSGITAIIAAILWELKNE
jgi:hypothetical protein